MALVVPGVGKLPSLAGGARGNAESLGKAGMGEGYWEVYWRDGWERFRLGGILGGFTGKGSGERLHWDRLLASGQRVLGCTTITAISVPRSLSFKTVLTAGSGPRQHREGAGAGGCRCHLPPRRESGFWGSSCRDVTLSGCSFM